MRTSSTLSTQELERLIKLRKRVAFMLAEMHDDGKRSTGRYAGTLAWLQQIEAQAAEIKKGSASGN